MASRYNTKSMSLTGALLAVGLSLSCIAAWITHVIWIVGKLAGDAGATAGQIVLGIIGTIVPPVGMIHGFMLWFT